MERKRKLPPRAAARQEQAAKRRNVETRGTSSTAAVVRPPPREPTPPPPPPTPPPALPKAIEAGKPLPTVEDAQPADLSSKEYQSLVESGVLSESIVRSRQRWISEGLFEKFWSKPHKRKGVLQEDPNNPPKDSMMKLGIVTITIEPHIVEATMYAVKTSKLLPHQQERFNPKPQRNQQQQSSGNAQQTQLSQTTSSTQLRPQQHVKPASEAGQSPKLPANPTSQQTSSALARPVLQYGPHNGSMPPHTVSPAVSTASPPVDSAETTAPSASSPAGTSLPSAAPKKTVLANAAPARSTNAPPETSQAPGSSAAASIIASASQPASLHPESTMSAQPFFAPVSLAQRPSPAQVQGPAPKPAGVADQKWLSHSSNMGSQGAAPPAGTSASAQPRTSSAQASSQPVAAPQTTARPVSDLPPSKQGAVAAPNAHPAQGAARRPAFAANQPAPAAGKPLTPAGAPAAPAKSAANDPVIALLAQKASRDPDLRDLMKRVAVGEAKDGELAKFQKIIDQLNAEYRQKGGQQGPSADRLLVDGRTVKYFADEVRTILDIVLASNPNQKSSELRPPPRSDPLVVLLVKTALEDQRTKDMIRRIAEGKPGFTDATDLKQILDRLHRDAKITPQAPLPKSAPLGTPATSGPSASSAGGPQSKASAPKPTQQSNPQALRSKGPPPAGRPDISAVVFDFGSGDRYLFPKYSILEFVPTKSGQQVVASFLIVRKGSTSEYGGDPDLDYYQPVTIRLQSSSGRLLENLARVVAPQDEVRRYMDDVMDNMTRAEYVLLAMRLPHPDFDPEESTSAVEDHKASSPSPKSEPETDRNSTPKPGVLWTTNRHTNNSSNNKAVNPSPSVKLQDPEQEAQTKYERLIRSVAEKEVDGL